MADPIDRHRLWPFSLIPIVSSDKPPAVAGNFTGNADVPKSGFAFSFEWPFGISFAAKVGGYLVRVGTFRYDYVDKYYTFPTFTVKKRQ